ncbi:hypothetical protein HO173_006389 [Letharia columbiana]|uniref:Myb-like DNA-binding domain-containing protein n=1 Tax=Letharia columbiana TaxID=112416 RepID=A0A8H6FUW6_9LECA|nr:uncharacterized protein HO173_006389 [Letharia columbiana]KAF6235195.1 hypothetical protein HO173_006389 [Letharia columbiana]
MASLKRSRTMPTDGAISKFLYVIMKQLDLKSIDWQQVADQLDIAKGHAARMRYSRFKQQMEGVPSAPRKARATVPHQRKAKPHKSGQKDKRQKEEHQGTIFKAEKEETMDAVYQDTVVKVEKEEDTDAVFEGTVLKVEKEEDLDMMSGVEPFVKDEVRDDVHGMF